MESVFKVKLEYMRNLGTVPEVPGLRVSLWGTSPITVRVAKADLAMFAPATAQKNINIAILSEVLIPLPSIIEQQEIVRRIDLLFKFADKIEARYKKVKVQVDKLTQSILAKAFRGELVP